MSAADRRLVLNERKAYHRPWHAPPHFEYVGEKEYILTSACFEHKPIIGLSQQRMAECEKLLLELCHSLDLVLFAWCILPNHYHLLVRTAYIKDLLAEIGRFHGSSSHRWNGEDATRGRKVWYRCFERSMKSSRHFFATLNYIHHNPVKHGYVSSWQDWPFSSGNDFLDLVGRDRAIEIWREYPILDYGAEWDR
jgi:putative transposase